MKNKKNIIIYIIVMLLLVTITVVSYAYFSSKKNLTNNNIIISANLPEGTYILEMSNPDSLSYTFSPEKMLSTNVSLDPIATDNTTFNVSLAVQGTGSIACEYDLVWQWDGENSYTASHGNLPINDNGNIYNYELSVKADSITSGGPQIEYNNNLSETDLSNFTWNNNKTTLISGATIVSDSTTPTVTTWTVTSNLYNIPVNQAQMAGKSFIGKITMENVDCHKYNEPLYAMMKKNADTTTTIDFNVQSSVSGTNGIYATTNTDNGITVYYYRGTVDNNLKFAGFCWKIIRTTETGGTKILYNGTPNASGGCTETSGIIGSGIYNSTYSDNTYVGYMVGSAGAKTYADTHSNLSDSIIKTMIDEWYEDNIQNNGLTVYLEDTVYCNDRNLVPGGTEYNNTLRSIYSVRGYGRWPTGYGAVARSSSRTLNASPSLVCKNTTGFVPEDNDAFTVSSIIGNGKLKYPVGLITSDEVVYAGMTTYKPTVTECKDSNYLSSGNYWTMSPSILNDGGNAIMSRVYLSRNDLDLLDHSNGVRPVVSLRPGIKIADGDGSQDKPYIIEYD